MKIEYDNDKLVIFLNKLLIGDLDFNNMDNLADYFKQLFIKLKSNYKIKLNGFYYIYVYIDELFGIVLEIISGDSFFDYDDNDVDMHISLYESKFLYKISDYLNFISDKYDIIKYKGEYYICFNENTMISNLYEISEFGYLIYKDTNDIIRNGKKINS